MDEFVYLIVLFSYSPNDRGHPPRIVFFICLVDYVRHVLRLPFTSSAFRQIIQTYFQFKEIPDDFFYLYEFKPTDTFILNITGENRLYELQKEQYIEKLTLQNTQIAKESLTVAKESATYAKKAYYAAIIIGIIGILLGIQEKLISLIQSIFY